LRPAIGFMSALMAVSMHSRALRPLLLLLIALCGRANADTYPDRPIHLVVPFPPGGPVGVVAEVVGPKLEERLGQKVIVEHRSGADGIIGSDFVAKAPSDGYTLLLASTSLVIHPGTYNVLPFDTEAAFAPVSLLVAAELVLVVNPELQVESVEELIAYARRRPGGLTYASGGLGGPTQMAFELFKLTAGINISHIAFDGGAAALLAVANGDAQVMMAPTLAAIPMIKDGRLRGLAVSGRNPDPAFPDLPPIAATVPGYSATSWFAVLAPAGTPASVIERLNVELDRIVHEPDTQKRFAEIGGDAVGGPPSTLTSLIHDEISRWRRVAKEAGIHIE
jgi:tripartite-type tricarboxylate transporter receptor subunit TctC